MNVQVPVLVIGNFLSATVGARGLCEDLSHRLAAAGWPIYTASDRVGRLSRLLDMVGSAWHRRHAYAVAQVDVFSGAAFIWAEAVCWTLRRARKPYVLVLRGGELPGFARRHPGRVRRLLQSAAVVTTPSRYLQEQMAPYRRGLDLLPNPLELSAYPFRLREHPRPRLMWLRAFHGIYNPSLAPEVVARLAGSFPDVHLTMVGRDKGDGSLQRTQKVAAAVGVAGRLELPGGVPKADVPQWLSRGDIFLNTTNIDNTPTSVLEAMACGLCVVSTDVGGIPYLLEDEYDALLVPPNDAEAMAAAVRRVLTEPGLAGRISRNARDKAADVDWKAVLPRWQALLIAAAGNGVP